MPIAWSVVLCVASDVVVSLWHAIVQDAEVACGLEMLLAAGLLVEAPCRVHVALPLAQDAEVASGIDMPLVSPI